MLLVKYIFPLPSSTLNDLNGGFLNHPAMEVAPWLWKPPKPQITIWLWESWLCNGKFQGISPENMAWNMVLTYCTSICWILKISHWSSIHQLFFRYHPGGLWLKTTAMFHQRLRLASSISATDESACVLSSMWATPSGFLLGSASGMT